MKKTLSMILALAMMFSLAVSQVAFAAEADEPVTSAVVSADENEGVQPYGSLSGSIGLGVPSNGKNERRESVTFKVSGVPWFSAQARFSVGGFNSKTRVVYELFFPNGDSAWYTSTLQPGQKEEVTLRSGPVGTYTLAYWIYTTDGSAIPDGMVHCTVY